MFVETYADWADHAKTLKLGAARQARQVSFLVKSLVVPT